MNSTLRHRIEVKVAFQSELKNLHIRNLSTGPNKKPENIKKFRNNSIEQSRMVLSSLVGSYKRSLFNVIEGIVKSARTTSGQFTDFFSLQRILARGMASILNDAGAELERQAASTVRELSAEIQTRYAKQSQELSDQHLQLMAFLKEMLLEIQTRSALQSQIIHDDLLQQTSSITQGNSALLRQLALIDQYSQAAASRVTVRGNADEVLVRTNVGYVLCPAGDYALIAGLVEGGELERGTRLVIERLVKPGTTFIDVGANVGMHTVAAARAMKNKGKIISFEPMPQTAKMLEKTVWINGFSDTVKVIQAAVSNSTGVARLNLGMTSGHNSLYSLPGMTTSGQFIDVPMLKLDDALDPTQPIDLIKIDVEGAEYEVVLGAKNIIAKNSSLTLIVECAPSHIQRSGQSFTEWINQFSQLGFEYRAIDDITGSIEARTIDALERSGSTNLIFARNASEAWDLLK